MCGDVLSASASARMSPEPPGGVGCGADDEAAGGVVPEVDAAAVPAGADAAAAAAAEDGSDGVGAGASSPSLSLPPPSTTPAMPCSSFFSALYSTHCVDHAGMDRLIVRASSLLQRGVGGRGGGIWRGWERWSGCG